MARKAIHRGEDDGKGGFVEREVRVVNVLRDDVIVLHEALEPEAEAWIKIYGDPGDKIVGVE